MRSHAPHSAGESVWIIVAPWRRHQPQPLSGSFSDRLSVWSPVRPSHIVLRNHTGSSAYLREPCVALTVLSATVTDEKPSTVALKASSVDFLILSFARSKAEVSSTSYLSAS